MERSNSRSLSGGSILLLTLDVFRHDLLVQSAASAAALLTDASTNATLRSLRRRRIEDNMKGFQLVDMSGLLLQKLSAFFPCVEGFVIEDHNE